MKFLIVSLALLAVAYADVSELFGGYDYPHPVHHEEHSEPIIPHHPEPVNAYIPPAPVHVHHEEHSEPIFPHPAPVNTYIPPAPVHVHHEEHSEPIFPHPAPVNTYIPPAPAHVHHEEASPFSFSGAVNEIEQPADDGYHYRTVRRRVFRYRH